MLFLCFGSVPSRVMDNLYKCWCFCYASTSGPRNPKIYQNSLHKDICRITENGTGFWVYETLGCITLFSTKWKNKGLFDLFIVLR